MSRYINLAILNLDMSLCGVDVLDVRRVHRNPDSHEDELTQNEQDAKQDLKKQVL
jgi:hypothetical protein